MNQKLLYLETRTFRKEIQSLYDYDSTSTKDKDIVLNQTSCITRHNQQINSDYTLNNDDKEYLLNINYNNNEFTIENVNKNNDALTEMNYNNLDNNLWFIINNQSYQGNRNTQNIDNTNDDYFLNDNDIIKFGRSKFRLSEKNIFNRQNNIDIELNEEDNNNYDIHNLNRNAEPLFNNIPILRDASDFNDIPENEKICKVCYLNNYDRENNPLMSMCKCSGGIKFTHFLCIKTWMKTKLVFVENSKKTVKNYYLPCLNCEICKTPFPTKFRIKGLDKTFELIDIDRPTEQEYLVLESLNQMKNNSNFKSIHVIKLTGEDIIFGRNKECDIYINDISVSRNHALLKYNVNDGKILIKDLKSRFGTLVLVQKPLKINDKKIHLQIGRTYIGANTMYSKKFYKAIFKVEHMEKEEEKNINQNDKMEIEEENNEKSKINNMNSNLGQLIR